MTIPASAVTAYPLRRSVLSAPQPHGNTGLARETAVLGLAEKTFELTPAWESATLVEINQALEMAAIGLQFEFDKEADKMIAKVVDVGSGEVIRQMPSEEVVRISKALGKLQGLLMHQTILKRWCESRKPLKN